MKVEVNSVYTGVKRTFEGSRAVLVGELLRNYSWLNQIAEHRDLESLVEHLDSEQAFEAEVTDYGNQGDGLAKKERNLGDGELGPDSEIVQDMLGHDHNMISTFDAARHLVRGQEPHLDQVRRHLWDADGDMEVAALKTHGIEPSPGNLRALRAVRDLTRHAKAEPSNLTAQSILPGTPDAQDAAEAVSRAFKDRFVFPVQMAGKHSAGTLLARDVADGEVWLLKPGSGGDSPAAGIAEERASQSRRETGFWAMAERWDLQGSFPEARLVIVDGTEYAAIRLLPWRYKTVDKLQKTDPNVGRALLKKYLENGLLFKWAVIDGVLGNTDRHANNMMADAEEPTAEADVKLIDQGSSMAGKDFDPANDQNSFVPFYLRAWAPAAFNKLSSEEKLRVIPHLSPQAEEGLRSWMDGLHADELHIVLNRFGVNPEPASARLAKLKLLITQGPADVAVAKFWCET